ncbi:MAG: hypothetical protein K0U54_08045, partial [Bacteroidetes bacterium]|nr:hypothetical protein [Bacteroidota bacterium]
ISRPKINIENLIEKTFNTFNILVNADLSYKSLFQLMSIITTAAQLQSDYHQILPFAKKIYEIVSEKENQAEKHIFYHIEISHLMALTYFRNKDFEHSEHFSEIMKAQMHKNNNRHFKRFQTKLILIQALNKNYTGDHKAAINLLENSKTASLDITLTLCMCLFQQRQFRSAYSILKKLNHSDIWYEKKTGWTWVVKKNIMELLLLIELDKLDLVLSRLNSFERRYYKRLKELGEWRVIRFMRLVSLLYEQPESSIDSSFKERVENSFTWKEATQEDIFVMSFYAWLKSRMENKPLYQTTLDLVAMT